ncbi:MAG: DNA ligase, partial [Candidatus Bathyarchaeia archaeon]
MVVMVEEETAFEELALVCEKLAATRGRNEKIELVSRFLKGLRSEEVSAAVLLLLGWVLPEDDTRALSVGFAAVSKARERRGQTQLARGPLTIMRVDEFFKQIASATGLGSRQRKEGLLQSLLSQASELEAKWILKNISGEMQHGVNEGLMLEAIAKAAGVSSALTRRANMFAGDLGRAATIALTEGSEGLRALELRLFTPVKPMLAEISYSLDEALKEHGGRSAFEYKLDGARVQVHRRSGKVRVFTRRLTEVTESLPEVVEYARQVRAEEFILDGEAVAVGENGKPLPFQDLMRRFKR